MEQFEKLELKKDASFIDKLSGDLDSIVLDFYSINNRLENLCLKAGVKSTNSVVKCDNPDNKEIENHTQRIEKLLSIISKYIDDTYSKISDLESFI